MSGHIENPQTYRPHIVRVCKCGGRPELFAARDDDSTFIVVCVKCRRRAWACDDYRAAWALWNDGVHDWESAEKWVAKNGRGRVTQFAERKP